MKVMRLKASEGLTWFHQSILLYGRYVYCWISMGLFLSFLSMLSSWHLLLSIVFLVMQPVLIGMSFYFIHCCLIKQDMLYWRTTWWPLLCTHVWRWIGLSIVLLIITCLFYITLLFICFQLVGWVSDFQTHNFVELLRSHNFAYAVSYYTTHYNMHWFIWIIALFGIIMFILVQTASLYAPVLMIAETMGYKKNMKVAQSIFSSIIMTVMNWLPLLVNSLYFICTAFFFTVTVLFFLSLIIMPLFSQSIYLLIFIFSLITHCVLLPILAIDVFLSFRAIFKPDVSGC